MNRKPSHWFFIRGLARETGHWGSFARDFEARVPGAQVTCLDLPGFGRHRHMRSPVTIPAIATFARAEFLRARQGDAVGTEAYVLAPSLGAMVVVEWLRTHPEDLRGAVLLNTSFKGWSPVYKRLWIEAYRHLFKALREPDPYRRELHVLRMVSNRPEIHEETARAWAEIFSLRPMSRANFARQLFAASRYQPELGRPPVPVLVLNSLRDRMVHPSCSEQISQRWNCEMRRHPTAGHDLTLDAPEWVIEQVNAWRQELESTDGEKAAHP